MMERNHALQVMDQLDALILKKGWPVPMTPYSLVHHETLLSLLEQLRSSLQDERDEHFIYSFSARTKSQELRRRNN
jgi:hypothetical protein